MTPPAVIGNAWACHFYRTTPQVSSRQRPRRCRSWASGNGGPLGAGHGRKRPCSAPAIAYPNRVRSTQCRMSLALHPTGYVTLMSLNRLPPRKRAEMISQMTGGKALPREITNQIVERTDGVPLYIEELTKTVIESGVVADAGDRYTVRASENSGRKVIIDRSRTPGARSMSSRVVGSLQCTSSKITSTGCRKANLRPEQPTPGASSPSASVV
jgi:hypothetical protein